MAHLPVDEAFRAVPRIDFLRPADRAAAAVDGPLPIGRGQTSSQPRTVRAMLSLLDVATGHRVLDVGAGSGWATGLLGHLVGSTGRVVGVELEPQLAAWGARNLAAHDLPWASIRPAEPDVLGAPDLGPYDRILVSAAARELPQSLVDQLADDGVMVIPVGAVMTRVHRTGPRRRLAVTEHGAYSFVPLR